MKKNTSELTKALDIQQMHQGDVKEEQSPGESHKFQVQP